MLQAAAGRAPLRNERRLRQWDLIGGIQPLPAAPPAAAPAAAPLVEPEASLAAATTPVLLRGPASAARRGPRPGWKPRLRLLAAAAGMETGILHLAALQQQSPQLCHHLGECRPEGIGT